MTTPDDPRGPGHPGPDAPDRAATERDELDLDEDGAPDEPGHLSAEQLDRLAIQASADTAPDQDVTDTPAEGLLHAHLASCARCRTALGDQVSVLAWLRRAPDPGPMPSDVVARLDAALAGAASGRAAASGPGGAGATVGRDHPATVLPLPGGHGRSRLAAFAESRATKTLVAAALVGLIAVGGYAAINHKSSPASSASSASKSAGGDSAGAAAAPDLAAVPVRHSGTAYTTKTINGQVTKQLATPAGDTAGGKAPETSAGASTLTTPAGLRDCLSALGVGTVTPLLVDVSTFNGKPVVVLVLPGAGTTRDVWVVSRTCSGADDGTAYFGLLR